MRKYILAVLAVGFLSTTAYADNVGSSFGALMTAQSLAQGRTALGARVGIAEATSFVGSLAYGFSNMADGRVKLGMVGDNLDESELTVGADAKWQIWRAYTSNDLGDVGRTNLPFDLAIGPFFEWMRSDFQSGTVRGNTNATQLGLAVVGSYPLLLDNGSILSPYARVNGRNEWVSVDANNSGFDGDESHIAAGLNTGLAWRPRASPVALYGEVQIDGNNGVFVGMDYILGR